MSHARIARELHVSRTTVVKYASREDFSPRPAGRAGRTLIDSGYAEIVEGVFCQVEVVRLSVLLWSK